MGYRADSSAQLCVAVSGELSHAERSIFCVDIWGAASRSRPGFFVATLSPVLGFIMLYTFRYTFVADHYQYLACIGPIALASAGRGQFGRHV